MKMIADRTVSKLTTLELPETPPATLEEIERRRKLFAQAIAFRDRIGPIGISTTDLIREVRDEAEAESDGW